jgi:predicted AlkP superfamily phosphohydrolase/phosphomutase
MPKFLRIILQISLLGGIIAGIFGILKGLGFVLINGMFIQHITSIILLTLYSGLGFSLIGIFMGFCLSLLLVLFRKKQKNVQRWISPIFLLILASAIFLGGINSRNLIIEFGNMLPPQSIVALKISVLLQGLAAIGLLIEAYRLKKVRDVVEKKPAWFSLLIPGILILILFIDTAVIIHRYQKIELQKTAPKLATAYSLPQPQPKLKIIVFAWDAATWDVINPLLQQKKLPNLQKLIDKGASGPLHTFRPTKTPVIWADIVTGKNPMKHGIYEFSRLYYIPGIPEEIPITSMSRVVPIAKRFGWCKLIPNQQTDRRVKAVWNIAGDNGKSVGVINMWETYPAEPVNGFMVSSHFLDMIATNTTKIVYPESIYTTIRSLAPTSKAINKEDLMPFISSFKENPERNLPKTKLDKEIQDYIVNVAYRPDKSVENIAKILYQRYQPDLLLVYFEGGDIVCHKTWKYYRPQDFWNVSKERAELYGNVIPRYYEYLDSVLGYYVNQLDENTILFVISDHGMESIPAWTEKIHSWLGPHISAEHEDAPDGIIIMAGKGVIPKSKLTNATVFDVAPTLLWLFGLPVAQDMEGKVLQSGFNPKEFAPVREIPTYEFTKRQKTKSEALPVLNPEMEERLKSLGYIGK